MTITFPRDDIYADLGAASVRLSLMRRDEFSRRAGGATLAREMASPLWRAEVETRPYYLSEMVEWEAKLASLDAGNTFWVYDKRRPFPLSTPTEAATPTGVEISTLSGDRRLMALAGLSGNYQLSTGDYLAFGYGANGARALHQVMEPVAAYPGGATPFFEVRPHIRPGAQVGDSVTLRQPSIPMMIEPGSLAVQNVAVNAQSFSFTAIQVLP